MGQFERIRLKCPTMLWSRKSLCEKAKPEVDALARRGSAERVRLSDLLLAPATPTNWRVSGPGGRSRDSGNLVWRPRIRETPIHRVYLNEVDTPLGQFERYDSRAPTMELCLIVGMTQKPKEASFSCVRDLPIGTVQAGSI